MDDEYDGPRRHLALADALADEIKAGVFPVGSRYPTDAELKERLGIGRHTVREALKILTEQGFIGRRRKTGTVVLSNRPIAPSVHTLRDVKSLLGLAQSSEFRIRHEGFVTKLSRELLEADSPAETRWLRLAGTRMRWNDGSPLCWSELYIPERFAPLRPIVPKAGAPIYEAVLEHAGLKLDYVEQKVTAVPFPRSLAELLDADGVVAGLLVLRRYVSTTGETFEISSSIYPAGRFIMRDVIKQRI